MGGETEKPHLNPLQRRGLLDSRSKNIVFYKKSNIFCSFAVKTANN
jgi:hypothetical protein